MSRAVTSFTPTLRVGTIATREAAPFFSNLVRSYLVEGVGCVPEDPEMLHVRLALTEAVTNVIRHGYPNGAPGPLEMELRMDGNELVAVLFDEAERFDPRERVGSLIPRPEEMREGGYGLGIIFAVMDEVQHAWDDGNRLTLKKRLTSAAPFARSGGSAR